MDEKFHIIFRSFIAEHFNMVTNDDFDHIEEPNNYDIEDIDALKTEVRKLYDLSDGIDGIISNMSQDINNLLVLINKELNND